MKRQRSPQTSGVFILSCSAAGLSALLISCDSRKPSEETDKRHQRLHSRDLRDQRHCRRPPALNPKGASRALSRGAVITSEWSPRIESACLGIARAVTWITSDVSSPATLYMVGILQQRPVFPSRLPSHSAAQAHGTGCEVDHRCAVSGLLELFPAMNSGPYLPVLVLLVAAVGFALAPLLLAWIWAKKFSPQKPGPTKNAVYECGLESEGDAWIQFKPGYYLYGIIFLVFDVEAVFLLPFAASFTGFTLAESIAMLVFLLLLVEGLVWAYQKKVLVWT